MERDTVKSKPNIVSLFAGGGGLEIAACSTGKVRKIVSTDSNATFLETTNINMSKHFPGVIHESIVADVCELVGEALLDLLRGEPDLVMGGPPCDDFTRFGRRLGMGGIKGPLIFEYLRLVGELRPRYFIFENVPNLVQQFRGVFGIFLNDAEKLGYKVEWRLMSASDFGAPTMRKRIIAVGQRTDGNKINKKFEFPFPTHGEINHPDLFTTALGLRPLVTVADVLAGLPDVKTPEANLYQNHTGRTHRPKTVQHMETVPQGVQVRQSYRYRAPWDGLCRSLTAGLDESTKSYIHPFYHREMSVREYARLHGFPDSWFFCGTHHNGIKQVANSVPVPMGTAVLDMVLGLLIENS